MGSLDLSNLKFDDLLDLLSNPLDDSNLMRAVLMDKLNGNRSNIRELEVEGSKRPDDSEGFFLVMIFWIMKLV